MSAHLLRVLSVMLPNADIDLVSNRPWHSLTFSGAQVSVRIALPNNDHRVIADRFKREMSEHDFDLPGQFVADIGVTEKMAKKNRLHLTIDALLLDD